jgi:serine/threonine protein kinase
MNEVKLREQFNLQSNFVVDMVQAHNADEDYNYRHETIVKRFEDYRYLVVSLAGRRSLDDIVRHDNIAGKHSMQHSRTPLLIRRIILAVQYLHSQNIVHNNLHRKYLNK